MPRVKKQKRYAKKTKNKVGRLKIVKKKLGNQKTRRIKRKALSQKTTRLAPDKLGEQVEELFSSNKYVIDKVIVPIDDVLPEVAALLPEDKNDDVNKLDVEAILVNNGVAKTIFELNNIEDPLKGTPQEVKNELDALALKMQKHPTNEECFNKIHFYIHKYLLGLVFKKFNFIKGYDECDMYQESLIALFKKAIPNFNPNKGMSFLNFAKMCINRHLITILHASKHRKKNIPMNTAVSLDWSPSNNSNDDNANTPLSNVIPDNTKILPYKKIADKENYNNTIEYIKNRLSKFETVVFEEYLTDKSYKEMARSISKRLEIRFDSKSIDNALLRIRKKAREIMAEKRTGSMPIFS